MRVLIIICLLMYLPILYQQGRLAGAHAAGDYMQCIGVDETKIVGCKEKYLDTWLLG